MFTFLFFFFISKPRPGVTIKIKKKNVNSLHCPRVIKKTPQKALVYERQKCSLDQGVSKCSDYFSFSLFQQHEQVLQ